MDDLTSMGQVGLGAAIVLLVLKELLAFMRSRNDTPRKSSSGSIRPPSTAELEEERRRNDLAYAPREDFARLDERSQTSIELLRSMDARTQRMSLQMDGIATVVSALSARVESMERRGPGEG